jgi:Lon protease-like protein
MPRSVAYNALPETIPVFPVEGAVVMPKARLPLNIFEPRYLAMLDDVLKSEHRLIGMIQPRDDSPKPSLYAVGCAGRVTSFSETDDGRYLIALTGRIRFRIKEEVEGFKPYRNMIVDWSEFREDLGGHHDADFGIEQRKRFLSLLKQYFEAAELNADWESLSGADEETLVNAISMLCPFSPQEKQALLEAGSLSDRLRDLETLMQMVVASPGDTKVLQ